VTIALMMMTLVVCCFVIAPGAAPPAAPLPNTVASLPLFSMAMIFAAVPALRAVLTAYDGWYSPIYMAEENTNPVRTLPRAIIGGTLLIAALYLLINLALLYALPLPVLAGSELPAAEAARIMFPRGGAELVTIIAIFTMLSLANNILLSSPRILFAIGRDGLFSEKAASVSPGGTPRVALACTSVMVVVVMLSGTFEQVVAMYSVLFLLCYTSAFLALFVLRIREPGLPRPFKVFAWPLSTGIVLLGSVVFLVVAIIEDPRSGIIAAVLLAACFPVYRSLERRRRAPWKSVR
jgi:APA family basic amino acid/polyamine antiporter